MISKGDKTIILMSSKVLGATLSFLGGILVARSFSLVEYASYSQVMLIASTFVIVPAVFQQSLYYFIPSVERTQKKRAIFSGITAGFIFTCILLILFFSFHKQLTNIINNNSLGEIIPQTIFFILCFSLSGYIDPIFISLEKEIKLAYAKSLCFLFALASICISIVLKQNMGFLFLVLGAAYMILPAYTIYESININKTEGFFSSISWAEIKKQFAYGLPLLLSSLITIIGRKLDQYLISIYFDTKEYAIYARGAIDLPFTEIVTLSIFSLMIPEIVRLYKHGNIKDILTIWKDGSRRVALLFFPFTGCFILNAKPLIIFLFTE
jgi:O-antigen/teichoic acid export membrane protein